MPEDDDVFVKVSLQTIYAELLAIKEKLSVLPSEVQDHETRVRLLARRVWSMGGVATIGGAALSQILALFVQK
jgi:hypothetical protein